MSKVEVNQVTQQCGTTLTVGGGACKTAVVDATTVTLGRCGGTVSLASGATQSGFGRTGSVNWDTASIKTATFTAVSGNGYFCNTTSGVFNITMPASPTAGDIVGLKDYAGTFATNNLTIDRNGSKLDSTSTNKALATDNTSLTIVYVDGTQGWKPIEEGTGFIGTNPAYVVATGGTPCAGATSGDYKIHTFTGPGTLTVSCGGNALGSNSVGYMVIAGGGSGAAACTCTGSGSGGGAGGYREGKPACDSYTASPIVATATIPVSATPYAIVVGGGGSTITSGGNQGNRGSNSSFSTITSTGGGGGRRSYPPVGCSPGGSGGGGGAPWPAAPSTPVSGGVGNTPPFSPPQGNTGGTTPDNNNAGGGGGGAGAVGGNAPGGGLVGGTGGAGTTTSIDATPTARAGGGGGVGNGTLGPGGTGGGGAGGQGPNGGVVNATAGSVNTGGGGGGTWKPHLPSGSGAGGSGIVIVRYKFQ